MLEVDGVDVEPYYTNVEITNLIGSTFSSQPMVLYINETLVASDLIDDGVALEYPIVSITPSGDTVNIYVIERSIVILFDFSGLMVFNTITYGDISLDMSELKSGKYYLIINQNKYEFYVQAQKH